MRLLKSGKIGSNGRKCKLMGFLFVSIVGGMYTVQSESPGETKKVGLWGQKYFASKRDKKTDFDCKILFLYGDDRNGEKHERKEMDFLLEERGCGVVSRMDSKGYGMTKMKISLKKDSCL